MKKIFIVLVGILIMSCNQNAKENIAADPISSSVEQNIENFDWLLGNWKRLNEEDGKETFENWKKISELEYSGIGFTMENGDTISKELIRVIKSDDNWNLIVRVSADAEPVIFKGISHNANEFICENKKNDFPKNIKYWKNGQKLSALVYSPEMEISFEFEKLEL